MHKVGIVGIGVYIPDNFMTSSDIAEKSGLPEWVIREKLGIIRKPIPGPDDHPSVMGTKAAVEALKMAHCDPLNLNVVIWNGSQYKDYPIWLAGAKVADNIGAKKAWSFDMEAECGSMMVGMKLAKDMIRSDSKINTILLVSGYRNCDFVNYENSKTRFLYNLGAGGAAMVIKRGAPSEILETSIITDGSFADDVIVPMGGSREPYNCDGLNNGRQYLDVPDVESMRERLNSVSTGNFIDVIKESVTASGYSAKDIGYFAMLHVKRSMHETIVKNIGISDNRTVYLENYGHIGQNDQILSIYLGIKNGKIKNGDLIVMTGAGIGYIWAASTILWKQEV